MVFEPVKLSNLEHTDPKLSLGEFLLQYYRKRAAEGKTALIWADKGIHISYADLLRDAIRMATGLRAMGAEEGDVIALVTRNSPEVFVIFVGALFAGLKLNPSVAELSPNELRSNFELTKPRYILTRPEKAPDVEEAISDIIPRPEIILLEEKIFKEILKKGSHADPNTFQTAKIEDPSRHEFAYFYSSGTTGRQQAITQNDYFFIRNCVASIAPMLKHRGPYLSPSQNYWVTWLYGVTRCVLSDRPFLFVTNGDVDSFLQYIQEYKAIFTVGDRCGADVQREISELLQIGIYQEYGSTEMGYVTAANLDRAPVYGSAGTAIIGIKIVNPETEEEITERNKAGEIRVNTFVMNSYLQNPKGTAEAFDAQGWFKSGDLGYLTENNDLFIVDRIKLMLKYSGHQVAPGELEGIIKLMPGVADVAVGGKHDDIAGNIITALVVRKTGWDVTEDDVKNFLENKNLHDSKRLRGGVIFVEKLPRNTSGKLERRKVATMLNAMQE